MQPQLTSKGEGVGVASDGAIDEVPGVSQGKKQVQLQCSKSDDWSCLVHQTNKQLNR